MMVDFYDSGFNRIGTYQDRVPFVGDTTAIGQPALTETSSGNVVLMWEEGDQGGIKGRTFSSTGTILSPEFTYGGGASYQDPQLATLENGNYIFTFATLANQADLTPPISRRSDTGMASKTSPGPARPRQSRSRRANRYNRKSSAVSVGAPVSVIWKSTDLLPSRSP
ncbi:hypothetical protein ACSBOB_08070 [Mesorhizobium sp. ASY16-5R]|uniref:hypothetical protein n=1 Tax=Mesorhizobium sp. ASY16-5R TaxID=3445772 RepID=UPI003FA09761